MATGIALLVIGALLIIVGKNAAPIAALGAILCIGGVMVVVGFPGNQAVIELTNRALAVTLDVLQTIAES
jgi:hypothetical protein